MAGVAAGLATVGFIPWLSSFAVFLAERDLDQVRMTIAQTKLPVKLGAAYSGLLTGYTGKTHQSVEDIAIMRAMPNMTVIAPGDAEECRQAMRVATDLPGPVYFRLTRDPSPAIFGPDYRFEVGKGAFVRNGRDVALISTGVQTTRVLQAADLLAKEGIEATVLHLPTIKPLDSHAIVLAAASEPEQWSLLRTIPSWAALAEPWPKCCPSCGRHVCVAWASEIPSENPPPTMICLRSTD